jgi:hypothetical protein
VKIHYRDFHKKYDEWVPINSNRIAEVGAHSKGFGIGRKKKLE